MPLRCFGDVLPASEPIVAVTFDRLLLGAVLDASPVFLSDNLIALLIRFTGPSLRPKVLTFRLADSDLQKIAEVERTYEGDRVFSVSNNRLLVAGVRNKYLYSQNLALEWQAPMKALARQFPRADLIGEAGPTGEKLFRLSPVPSPVLRGAGEVLAVSEDSVLYEVEGSIRTTLPNGTVQASMMTGAEKHYSNMVEFAGPGRLFLSISGDERVTDLTGKRVVRVHPPIGWGSRHGWSADGTRLLFDLYRSSGSISNTLAGAVAGVLGSVYAEQASAELIHVIDVATGAVCFALDSPNRLLGEQGGYHADLSPSGRLIVVTSRSRIALYRLPNACSKL